MSRKMKAVEFTGPGGQRGEFDEEGVNTVSGLDESGGGGCRKESGREVR